MYVAISLPALIKRGEWLRNHFILKSFCALQVFKKDNMLMVNDPVIRLFAKSKERFSILLTLIPRFLQTKEYRPKMAEFSQALVWLKETP